MSNTISKALVLLRGLPGSGKSTLAYLLSEEGKYSVFSVDDYFTNKETGAYLFEFDKNHLAYKQCERQTEDAMKNNTGKIFVHNTFTMDWEMEPYFKLASVYGYRLYVLTVENYHGSGNIHGVSDEQLKKMEAKFKVKLM
ncbi:MAG: ATP-binding protein [Cytophagaceae bacterium]|nr:ATP-binding protein [Cytophagaceae bacterium]